MKHVLYLVNNLDDPANARRVRMLELGACYVTVVGFRRSDDPVPEFEGREPMIIGKTRDAKLADRAMRIVASLLDLWRRRARFSNVDSILARNLEMVVLAFFIRQIAARRARIIYECLDIHRIQIETGVRGRAFRALERALARKCSLIITSSPGFVREYFKPLLGSEANVIVIENKVLSGDSSKRPTSVGKPNGPPWIIGWFGALRCRRSFEILRALSNELGGQLSVLTAGRPAAAVFPDFDALLATAPHFRHLGTYRNPEDLNELYSHAHFSWAVDLFEAESNSRWLLPNRLYESCLFGTVPIAMAGTETARFMQHRGIGITLGEPIETCLSAFLRNLSRVQYGALAGSVEATRRDTWAHTTIECEALVQHL